MLRQSTKVMFNKPSNYLISLLSWIVTESTDTFLENEYRILRAKSKQRANVLKTPKMSLPQRNIQWLNNLRIN